MHACTRCSSACALKDLRYMHIHSRHSHALAPWHHSVVGYTHIDTNSRTFIRANSANDRPKSVCVHVCTDAVRWLLQSHTASTSRSQTFFHTQKFATFSCVVHKNVSPIAGGVFFGGSYIQELWYNLCTWMYGRSTVLMIVYNFMGKWVKCVWILFQNMRAFSFGISTIFLPPNTCRQKHEKTSICALNGSHYALYVSKYICL